MPGRTRSTPTARSGPRRRGAGEALTLLLLLSMSAGCQAPTTLPPLPEASEGASATPATQLPAWPALAGPGRVYAYSAPLDNHVSPYTTLSRFVLYDDRSFGLQMHTQWRTVEYRGTYTEVGSDVAFAWEGWSVLGAWGATATLLQDTLTVQYNWVMLLNDFENAVYVLEGR